MTNAIKTAIAENIVESPLAPEPKTIARLAKMISANFLCLIVCSGIESRAGKKITEEIRIHDEGLVDGMKNIPRGTKVRGHIHCNAGLYREGAAQRSKIERATKSMELKIRMLITEEFAFSVANLLSTK